MGEDSEDGEEDHDDEGPCGATDGEETDHAYFGEVDAGDEVLQCFGVDESFSVNVDVVYEQEVVPVCLIDQVETDKGESKNKRCDAGVCQCCSAVS